MPTKILVLAFVHEGGEWFAVERLLREARKQSGNLRFYLVGYTEGYTAKSDFFEKVTYVYPAKAGSPLKSFKKILLDIRHLKKAIKKMAAEAGKVNLFFVVHYLTIFPIFLINIFWRNQIIFYFQGTKVDRENDGSVRKDADILAAILEKLALILSPQILIPSKYAEGVVRKIISGFDKRKKFHLVPNSAPSVFYKEIPKRSLEVFRNDLEIDNKTKVVLYSGRLVKRKGIENLVDAFIEFSKRQSNSRLIIAFPKRGSDQVLLHRLKARLEENLLSKVTFLQNLQLLGLRKLYKASGVVVLASEIEMAPLVIVESIASGTPVIATDVGNAKEILKRVNPNLILKKTNPKEILKKLNYFFSLPNNKLSAIKKNAKIVALDYRDSKSAEKFIQILKSFET